VVTNLLNQVGQLQAQVQQLSGRVDTLQNQVDQQNAATTKAIGDINFKLGNGPAAPGTPAVSGAPTALVPPTTAPAAPPVAPTVPAAAAASPKNLLKEAQAAYAKHDYTTAESDARALVAKGGPQAYTGQYLLAESLAAEGRHQDAAIAYDDAYNKNREGADAAASLLGLANSLTDINQSQAACDTLSSLNSQFPTPPAGLGPKITAASHRAHCS
jgi:TolA-binding protein